MTERVFVGGEESPFSRFRRLKSDPRFIEAVTAFCDDESYHRYLVACEYAQWWPANVRSFRFELLVILERDIAIETLIERQMREQLRDDEHDAAAGLAAYWQRKQLLAFWPRWVERTHALLASRIWTQQGLERCELDHRVAGVEPEERAARAAVQAAIMAVVGEVPLEWGAYVPPLVGAAREAERRRVADIRAQQLRDVGALSELQARQAEALERQRHIELASACDAGRLRLIWMWEQQWVAQYRQCFPHGVPNAAGDDDDGGDGVVGLGRKLGDEGSGSASRRRRAGAADLADDEQYSPSATRPRW